MSFNPDPFNRNISDPALRYFAERISEQLHARERAERTQTMLEPLRPIAWSLDDLKQLSQWGMTL